VLDAGSLRYVNRGCMALGLALEHAQIGDGDEVLLPAYHCISMVEPVVWRGARPVFYRINADTTIDLTDIESRITSRTRALLAPHYFGFPQDVQGIRRFCDAHRLLFIEDCAHAFFGAIDGKPFGSFGDYAIASAWKFFPVCDGGLLVSAGRDLSRIETRSAGLRFEAKAMINALEYAFEYRRLPVARLLFKVPLMLKDFLLRRARQALADDGPPRPQAAEDVGDWGFDAALIRQKMSLFSRCVTTRAARRRIGKRRRANYARLLQGLSGVAGCRPLFPTLPEQVVPHVFPLVMEEPERIFGPLKRRGVPIIRFGEYPWPDMPAELCPVSRDLSRQVFQFPCHQELQLPELDWMIDSVRQTLHAVR